MLKRRLFLQIYLTIIASLVVVVVLSGMLWFVFGSDGFNREVMQVAGRLAHLSLPPSGAPVSRQQAAVDRLAHELRIDITLYDRDLSLIAASGRPITLPSGTPHREGWQRIHRGQVWAMRLPDDRWLAVDLSRRGGHNPLRNLALFLGSVALGVGLVAYPFVRRLTRHLERLQKGVERIGSGDLSARVEIKGHDEVAGLAASFNVAAEKIENLISAHRLLLANASHELRTPLARIRLGVEMLNGDDDPARRTALHNDIGELDALIDEILLMSRLDAGTHADLSQSVDLVALAAEECARYSDCVVTGAAPEVRGDPRLLQRMLRNLLENARNHGAPPIEVRLSHQAGEVAITVSDGGSGIAEAEREMVFQPFYRSLGKQNVPGYGLGLLLVRQIAQTHGGTAILLPRDQHPSAVRVIFPGPTVANQSR